jgi:hypothetical protein
VVGKDDAVAPSAESKYLLEVEGVDVMKPQLLQLLLLQLKVDQEVVGVSQKV